MGVHTLGVYSAGLQSGDLRRIIFTAAILLNLSFDQRELGCCLTVNTVDVIICRLEYRPVLRFAH